MTDPTIIEKARKSLKKELKEEKSQAVIVAEMIAEDSQIQLFHDQFNVGYVAPLGDGRQVLRLRSRQAKNLITKIYFDKTKKVLGSNALQSTLQILEAKACYDGPLQDLAVRIADYEGAIWYDLGESAVRIDENGWEIIDEPPILFKRFPHQKKQVEPEPGGDIKDVLEFLNITDIEHRLLILIWLIFALVPQVPHPAPILSGPQGSKKTTFVKVLKELLDPSMVSSQSSQSTINEFVQTASHHWLIVMDNVTWLPKWLSDALCRTITGEGLSKRELFSDDEDILYSFRHCVMLNGINLVCENPDLLERSLLFSLVRTNRFQTERSFWAAFDDKKAQLLGAAFDCLSQSMKIFAKTPEPEGEFRMADFVHWGTAIAQALGYEQEEFISAYKSNVSTQDDEAIEASPIGTAIVKFMSDREEYEGTPTELLKELNDLVDESATKSKLWPKDVRKLWHRIEQVLTNLESKGIKADRMKSGERKIKLEKIANFYETVKNTNLDVQNAQNGEKMSKKSDRPNNPNDELDNKDISDISFGNSHTSLEEALDELPF